MKRETVLAIYKLIDWVMDLPEELETSIFEEIKAREEATNMSVITTAERIGIKQGIKRGIATILEIKSGEAGQQLSERADLMKGLQSLQKLMDELKRAHSLSEAEKLLDELESRNG